MAIPRTICGNGYNPSSLKQSPHVHLPRHLLLESSLRRPIPASHPIGDRSCACHPAAAETLNVDAMLSTDDDSCRAANEKRQDHARSSSIVAVASRHRPSGRRLASRLPATQVDDFPLTDRVRKFDGAGALLEQWPQNMDTVRYAAGNSMAGAANAGMFCPKPKFGNRNHGLRGFLKSSEKM